MKFKGITKILLLCAGCALSLCGCTPKNEESVIMEKEIIELKPNEYFYSHGRYSLESSGYYFAHSYSGFEIKVKTSGDAKVTFVLNSKVTNESHKQYAHISVDGMEEQRIEILENQKEYTIDINGEAKEVAIKFHKCNEATFSKLTLEDIKLTNAVFVPHNISKRTKIEVYGDSITCGYGVLAKTNTESFQMETEDACSAYGPLASKELQYDCSLVSFSGIGLAASFNYGKGFLSDNFDTIDGSKKWDLKVSPADIFIINIGTNDNTVYQTSTSDKASIKENYVKNYLKIVNALHETNPAAKFIFCFNMMTSLHQDLIMAIDEVYKECEKIMPGQTSGMRFDQDIRGANGHPGKEGHETFAEEIVEKIKGLAQR